MFLVPAKVGGIVAGEVLAELVVVAGQDGVEEDAQDGGDGQAGKADGHAGVLEDGETADAVEAQGGDQDHRRDDEVPGVGEVHLVLHHVAHPDGGDHAVEDEADAADDGGGDGVDDGVELGADREDDGRNRRDAEDRKSVV